MMCCWWIYAVVWPQLLGRQSGANIGLSPYPQHQFNALNAARRVVADILHSRSAAAAPAPIRCNCRGQSFLQKLFSLLSTALPRHCEF